MDQQRRRIDRMFVGLMFVQWAFAVGCAAWLSPFTWEGAVRQVHPHVWLALILGGMLAVPVAWAGLRHPGSRGTRHFIALSQMAFSSLLIHVTGGRIETHFHVFGSLAFLAAYRDWVVLLPATVFVAVDHFLRGFFWPETVFGVTTGSEWRWLEHAGWVLFEDLWLVICCRQAVREVENIARHRADLEQSHETLAQQAIALEETLQERDALVAGALDAIIHLDGQGRIRGWNSQASSIFGWMQSEAVGRSLVELIFPEKHRQARCQGSEDSTSEVEALLDQRTEAEAVRRDGTLFPIELSVTRVSCNGRSSYCAFVRDISERRQSEERLKHSKEEAEAASHAKSLFLANMSHEIRTPLNAILGFTDLLCSSESLSAHEQRSHLEAVHKSGRHLLAVINDILDLSKIEAGQMQYERIRFSPHQVIVDVLSLMRVPAAEKRIALEARWLGRVPETIESDPAKLRQLLINLVGNAVKFTEHGSVQILARIDVAEETLQIEVIDTGVGIPREKLESIFSPFNQADASVTRRFGGTGLGLSICRHISDALGGRITAQSCEGQGSTFTVTIATGPMEQINLLESAPTEALRTPTAAPSAKRPRLDNLAVLIVDDGETNRRLLQLLLTRAGATVTMAENGLSAVEQATRYGFDVILMDMQMPVMDGYSATSELRARGINTPIIALTAHAMAGEEGKCRTAGCDGYLTKPVNQEELIAVLSRLQITLAANAETARNDGGSSESDTATSQLDLQDPEMYDIVCSFAEQLEDHCAGLRAACSERDWQALGARAHSLKGTAAMTGFPVLSERVKALEELAKAQETGPLMQAITGIEALCERIRRNLEVAARAGAVNC